MRTFARLGGQALAGRGRGTAASAKKRACPICGKPTAETYRPFCSKRCADVDLGRWLDGRYAVPGESIGTDKDDGDKKN